MPHFIVYFLTIAHSKDYLSLISALEVIKISYFLNDPPLRMNVYIYLIEKRNERKEGIKNSHSTKKIQTQIKKDQCIKK